MLDGSVEFTDENHFANASVAIPLFQVTSQTGPRLWDPSTVLTKAIHDLLSKCDTSGVFAVLA